MIHKVLDISFFRRNWNEFVFSIWSSIEKSKSLESLRLKLKLTVVKWYYLKIAITIINVKYHQFTLMVNVSLKSKLHFKFNSLAFEAYCSEISRGSLPVNRCELNFTTHAILFHWTLLHRLAHSSCSIFQFMHQK